MDRLSSTESNVSATYGGRLNMSYYVPLQGFSYCMYVINIVDMQNKAKMKKDRHWKMNTCNDRWEHNYLSSAFQHI